MSKKAKSFEEFYSKNKDDILDIDIVADYAESHDGDTNYKYEDMTTRYDIPENGSFIAKYNNDQTEYTIYNASQKNKR